jgi:hypothetical protein
MNNCTGGCGELKTLVENLSLPQKSPGKSLT